MMHACMVLQDDAIAAEQEVTMKKVKCCLASIGRYAHHQKVKEAALVKDEKRAGAEYMKLWYIR